MSFVFVDRYSAQPFAVASQWPPAAVPLLVALVVACMHTQNDQ